MTCDVAKFSQVVKVYLYIVVRYCCGFVPINMLHCFKREKWSCITGKNNLSLQLDYQTKIEKIPLIVDETSNL